MFCHLSKVPVPEVYSEQELDPTIDLLHEQSGVSHGGLRANARKKARHYYGNVARTFWMVHVLAERVYLQ
jgi:hypothetical protein